MVRHSATVESILSAAREQLNQLELALAYDYEKKKIKKKLSEKSKIVPFKCFYCERTSPTVPQRYEIKRHTASCWHMKEARRNAQLEGKKFEIHAPVPITIAELKTCPKFQKGRNRHERITK